MRTLTKLLFALIVLVISLASCDKKEDVNPIINNNDTTEIEDKSNIGISDYRFRIISNNTNHTLDFNLDKSDLKYSKYGNGLNSFYPSFIDEGKYTGIIIKGLDGKSSGAYTSGFEITMPFSFGHFCTYFPSHTSEYTVKVIEFDENTGNVHLVFENVKMYLYEDHKLYDFVFSGYLIGTFKTK